MTTTAAQTFAPGTKVAINLPADSPFLETRWFPKHGATGTVERNFKNGRVAVAVDQVRNFSADRCKTLHFDDSSVLTEIV